jgi:hypothetical protein
MSQELLSPMHRLVRILTERGPMRAGEAGFELWGKGKQGKCENIQATMYVRPATKLLYRAQGLGLVGWRVCGKNSRIWYAYKKT